MLASQNGHTETVKCLIDGKASVDMQQEASIGLVIPKFYVNISELINNNVNKTKHLRILQFLTMKEYFSFK